MQEKRPRDRGKGLSPAPGQCVRTGGAGTAHHRSAAGAGQRTLAAASDLSAVAAEFSGLVFTAAIADGRAHAPCGIVLTEAKVKETGSWPHRKTVDAARFFHRSRASVPWKESGNGHLCQRVKCAHLNTITASKEIYIYGYYSKQRDIPLPCRPVGQAGTAQSTRQLSYQGALLRSLQTVLRLPRRRVPSAKAGEHQRQASGKLCVVLAGYRQVCQYCKNRPRRHSLLPR